MHSSPSSSALLSLLHPLSESFSLSASPLYQTLASVFAPPSPIWNTSYSSRHCHSIWSPCHGIITASIWWFDSAQQKAMNNHNQIFIPTGWLYVMCDIFWSILGESTDPWSLLLSFTAYCCVGYCESWTPAFFNYSFIIYRSILFLID